MKKLRIAIAILCSATHLYAAPFNQETIEPTIPIFSLLTASTIGTKHYFDWKNAIEFIFKNTPRTIENDENFAKKHLRMLQRKQTLLFFAAAGTVTYCFLTLFSQLALKEKEHKRQT